jgi:hypothetical protein
MYTCAYVHVVITSTWHLTCRLVNVLYRYLTALCFQKNCLLVVIISCIWKVTILLLFLQSHWWLNTIHIGNSLHSWSYRDESTSSSRIWESQLLVVLCTSFLVTKTLSQAYVPVRINLCAVG